MDLPDKSQPQQTPPPQQRRVLPAPVDGARKVKRPATRRFLDYAFAASPKEVGVKIGRDIVVPRLKAGVEEALNSFISGMMWGGGGKPMSNIVQGAVLRPGGGMQYHQVVQPNPNLGVTQVPSRSSGNYTDLVFGTQEAAEQQLANAFSVFSQYRMLTVADLYEMAKITPAPSDNSYGWLSLDGARISKSRDGYVLELPRPSLI